MIDPPAFCHSGFLARWSVHPVHGRCPRFRPGVHQGDGLQHAAQAHQGGERSVVGSSPSSPMVPFSHSENTSTITKLCPCSRCAVQQRGAKGVKSGRQLRTGNLPVTHASVLQVLPCGSSRSTCVAGDDLPLIPARVDCSVSYSTKGCSLGSMLLSHCFTLLPGTPYKIQLPPEHISKRLGSQRRFHCRTCHPCSTSRGSRTCRWRTSGITGQSCSTSCSSTSISPGQLSRRGVGRGR